MRRTDEILEQLRQANPVVDPDDKPHVVPAPRSSRSRFVIGAAAVATIAVAIVAGVALSPGEDSDGVIAAAAATAADQPPIDIAPNQFAYRSEHWLQASIPGQVADAAPDRLEVSGAEATPPAREGVREVWFSPQNRGVVDGDGHPKWPPCSAADWLISYVTDEFCWSEIGGPQGFSYLFEAPPQIQREYERANNREMAPYWEFSPDIARLGTDPEKIESAVADLAKQLQRNQSSLSPLGNQRDALFIEPTEPDDAPFQLRAVADLLANPLAPPDVRAALFEYAGGIDGIASSRDATDPEGREGAAISITSTPADASPTVVSDLPFRVEEPFSQYTRSGYPLDLSGLIVRTEIVFDTDTSELLSETTSIEAADDPLLGPWLEREGAPQTIYSRTFEPVTVVDSAGEQPKAE